MARVLHIDSSPRQERSKSRQLAAEFINYWKMLNSADEIIYRDLRNQSIPHVTEEWIAADFAPPEALTPDMQDILRVSDELVDEFLSVDRCIFSVPMYNFSIPSNFKAYIDQIVRIGRTFAIENHQFKGLVSEKKVLFITTRGVEYGAGSPYEGWDAQEPTLRFAFQFMGVADIQFIHASGMDMGDAARAQGLDRARAELQNLAACW